MRYIEETIARHFYSALKSAFGQGETSLLKLFRSKNFDISISIEGAGVHWQCKVEKDNRICSIACFNYDFQFKQGPEYYIEFIYDESGQATGRTSDNKLALNAIKDWIAGKTLPELYTTYKFVDQYKRKLQNINSALLSSNTAFKGCTPAFEQSWGDSFDYTLTNGDRAIQFYIDGYSNPPKNGFGFKFLWDVCPVFYAYSEDLNAFKRLVFDWLIKTMNPSEIKKIYPWINLYTIAAYYEKGEGVTGEFIESWDHVEHFYSEMEFHLKDKILDFIKSMRAKGFDKSLRAGTSLYSLILSKSRRHGLRQDQPSIRFSFGDEGIYIDSDAQICTLSEGFSLTEEISHLIESLNTKQIS
jgi:hypothetical protein